VKKDQKGFTLVEGLIALVVILLVGGLGYYVYDRNSDDGKDTAKTTQADNKTTDETSSNTDAKYLDIPELGVRLKLTSSVEDAYYTVSKEGYVYLSVHHFDKVQGFEQCRSNATNGEYGLASLNHAKVGDDQFGRTLTQDDLEGFSNTKIGDTYYWVGGSQAVCWDNSNIPDSNSDAQKAEEARKSLVDLTSAIEKL